MARFIVLFLLIVSLVGCAPAVFVPRELPQVKFEPTPTYSIDLSKIPKPDKLKPIFMDVNFKEVSADEASYVVLVPSEYAKIAALLKLCKTYKDIVKEQELLVNAHVQIINSLKEYLALERLKMEEYRILWADSENAYRQERYYHKMDNAVNKGAMSLISLGAIIGIILAL